MPRRCSPPPSTWCSPDRSDSSGCWTPAPLLAGCRVERIACGPAVGVAGARRRRSRHGSARRDEPLAGWRLRSGRSPRRIAAGGRAGARRGEDAGKRPPARGLQRTAASSRRPGLPSRRSPRQRRRAPCRAWNCRLLPPTRSCWRRAIAAGDGNCPSACAVTSSCLIWDGERGEGLLARDQLGVRPFYLHDSDGGVRFASEARHLIACCPAGPSPTRPAWRTGSRPAAVPGCRRSGREFVVCGPVGCCYLDRHGVREEIYWTPRFAEPLDLSRGPSSRQRCASGLERSVRRRIAADGATGVLMSGGLDSSAVAALCARTGDGAGLRLLGHLSRSSRGR